MFRTWGNFRLLFHLFNILICNNFKYKAKPVWLFKGPCKPPRPKSCDHWLAFEMPRLMRLWHAILNHVLVYFVLTQMLLFISSTTPFPSLKCLTWPLHLRVVDPPRVPVYLGHANTSQFSGITNRNGWKPIQQRRRRQWLK